MKLGADPENSTSTRCKDPFVKISQEAGNEIFTYTFIPSVYSTLLNYISQLFPEGEVNIIR